MNKRILTVIVATILLAFAVVGFSACTPTTPPAPELPDLSGIALADKTVTYNGEEHSLAVSGTLPEGVEVMYVNNGKVNAGEYAVTAKFYYNGSHMDGKDLTATLTVEKAKIDLSGISFENKTVTYDGAAHSIEISGTLPEGVTVTYTGNGQTVTGDYTVIAKFTATNDNYVIEGSDEMTAYLTIEAKEDDAPDLSGIALTDKTVTYNGEEHSLAVSGTLPEGVEVMYVNNGKVNAGEYNVTAKFYYNGNHVDGADLTATLTVEKAKIDISGISFTDKTVTYNGAAQSIELVGTLPAGVTASYNGNGKTDAGEYTVTVTLAVENDNYVIDGAAEMTAKLVIEKAKIDISGISFTDKTVTYNGTAQSIELVGTLPAGVTASYNGNGKVNAGEYTVTVTLAVENDNYVIDGAAEMTAKLVIEKAKIDLSGISFTDKTVTYNGAAQSVELIGTLPEGVTVTYLGNGKTEIGEYTVTAKLTVTDNNYYIDGATELTAKLVITAEPIIIPDLSGITLAGKTVTYNGEAQSLTVSGTLPEGITVSYEGNGKTDSGVYTVVAKLYYNGVYVEGADLTATLTVERATVSLAGITFAGKTVVYNGSAHSLKIAGTLPDYVTVTYTGNGKTEVGEYTVTASFAVTNTNYVIVGAAEMTAKLVIAEAAPVIPDLSGITLADKTVTYNGKAQSLAVSGNVPAGITVAYQGNGEINAGTYTVVAVFYFGGEQVNGADLTATLTIEKAKVNLSGVTFTDKTVICDGTAHKIEIEGTLPDYVTVTYTGNGKTEVGEYTVTAKLAVTNDNYVIEGATEMTAKLVITPAPVVKPDLSGITLTDKTVTYNGEAQSLTVSGTLPEGVTVVYEGNDKVNAGTYTVVAKLYFKGEHVEDNDLTATLTINKATIGATVNATEFTYTCDGEKKTPDAITLATDFGGKVRVVAIGAGQILPGTYKVIYRFVIDPTLADNISPREDVEVTMTITKNTNGTAGLVYVKNGDKYFVDGYTGTDAAVFIPATYEGLPVTAISGRAFENKTFIKYVSVPDSVTAIGQSAFRGCTSIEAITLPFIGGSAGSSNNYLGFIFGASGYVGNEQWVPASLKTVDISDACKLIHAYSFQGCANITEVRVGAGVEEIGNSAFRGCTSLKGIFLPANVKLIRAAANNYNSPFYDLSASFAIYLGASAVPAEYASKWNVLDSEGNAARVVTGKTYQEYLTEVQN